MSRKTKHGGAMLALLPMAAMLGACDQSATGPEAEAEVVYDLVVETLYIQVNGTCDKDDFFGNPNAGEFQYRVAVAGEGRKESHQSTRYNSVTGTSYKRHKGKTIDFADRSVSWTGLQRNADVRVTLSGVEWDGVSRDSDMNAASTTERVPFHAGTDTHSVKVGSKGSCEIELFYNATWAGR